MMAAVSGTSLAERNKASDPAALTQLQGAAPADAAGDSQTVAPSGASAVEFPAFGLPTPEEIAKTVEAQGFDMNSVSIAITYFSPSGQEVSYRHNQYEWHYPASTTKLVLLAYIYHYAYLHRGQGEDFNEEMIAADKPYISRMIRASDNDATLYLAKKYGRDKIYFFPSRALGFYGIETGWYGIGYFSTEDRVTALGMNRLISYIYDDKDTETMPLAVKKEVRKWLELPKNGNTSIQNKPIEHFLDNSGLPGPYDPKSGLSVGMKAGWTDNASGHVACFNWRPQGSRWTIAIYRDGNCSYFGRIGDLYRDLFLLFKDKQ